MGNVLGCLEENLWIQSSENPTGITIPRVYKGLEHKPHFCGISEQAGKRRNSVNWSTYRMCQIIVNFVLALA